MKKRSKQRKYDIIIYSSLIIALICVVISGIDYVSSMDKDQSVKDEVKDALIELKEPEVEETQDVFEEVEEEPDSLKELDKASIVQKYIDEIYDQISDNDEVLNYNMVKSWKKYEITDVKYVKQILDYYYAYQVNIKIYGNNPKLPVDKNTQLSTDEYTIITLNANILSSTKNNGYVVKTMEIPIN